MALPPNTQGEYGQIRTQSIDDASISRTELASPYSHLFSPLPVGSAFTINTLIATRNARVCTAGA
jgi:hypothetical protein